MHRMQTVTLGLLAWAPACLGTLGDTQAKLSWSFHAQRAKHIKTPRNALTCTVATDRKFSMVENSTALNAGSKKASLCVATSRITRRPQFSYLLSPASCCSFPPKWAHLQRLKSFQLPQPGFALPARRGFLPLPRPTRRWRRCRGKGLRKQKRRYSLCKVATRLCQAPASAALASPASQWYGNKPRSYSCMGRWMTCTCIFLGWGKIRADKQDILCTCRGEEEKKINARSQQKLTAGFLSLIALSVNRFAAPGPLVGRVRSWEHRYPAQSRALSSGT